jgi:predicted nucleic acid-binding protein
MVEERLGIRVLDAFLSDLESGGFSLHCGEEDFPRIRELVQRYRDLPLGFADASVIACAERHGGRALTVDERDFGVVAREGKIKLVP